MPDILERFKNKFPEVWTSYQNLKKACDQQGPLDGKTVQLIQIGVSAAMGREGGLIAHISRAKKAGARDEEIYHCLLLTLSLTGFPTTLAAFEKAAEYLDARSS